MFLASTSSETDVETIRAYQVPLVSAQAISIVPARSHRGEQPYPAVPILYWPGGGVPLTAKSPTMRSR